MTLNISGTFDLGSLKEYTEMKIDERLGKYGLKDHDNINIRFEHMANGSFFCHINMSYLKHELVVSEQSHDAKISLDKALDNLSNQLQRLHGKIKG